MKKKPDADDKKKDKKKPEEEEEPQSLQSTLLSEQERKEIRAGFKNSKGEADVALGPRCHRCSEICQVWPVKDLDAGHVPSIRLAPDDRAFRKSLAPPSGVDPTKCALIFRTYCAKCLRKKKVRKLVLAGKGVKRLKPVQFIVEGASK